MNEWILPSCSIYKILNKLDNMEADWDKGLDKANRGILNLKTVFTILLWFQSGTTCFHEIVWNEQQAAGMFFSHLVGGLEVIPNQQWHVYHTFCLNKCFAMFCWGWTWSGDDKAGKGLLQNRREWLDLKRQWLEQVQKSEGIWWMENWECGWREGQRPEANFGTNCHGRNFKRQTNRQN